MAEKQSNGIVIGVVISLEDPDKLGRVQVKYPHLADSKSDWARLVSPMAGKERGMFFRPEVDDEVVVAFEHNDPRCPYILGSLWSQTDLPPKDDGQAKKNNWRFIRSRSGHIIKLDDTSGSERIEIIDQAGDTKVVIDKNKIQILCPSGSIEMKAQSINITADGTLTLKGQTVNIN